MITQQKKREIEYIVESLPLWLKAKLSILFADNILTGDWEEFDYMLYCLDENLKEKEIKSVVRRIIR